MENDTKRIEGKLDRMIDLFESSAGARRLVARSQEKFWALEGLRERIEDDAGNVMIVGAVGLPTGETYDWQQAESVATALQLEWSDLSDVLGALGHPIRLIILQNIVNGTRSTLQLAAIPELGTTGQLHHHLRLLVAAGWLTSTGRGHYAVPAPRVVPLLAILVAADR
ncbi:hypothetical protein ADILRU_0922 [Leifsonia rubra CMS 76R]|nr:hypothetical protein ADILRU_0922 [Leifsonia rubra CMS 76R]